MKNLRVIFAIACVLIQAASGQSGSGAHQPKLSNARLQAVDASGGLENAVNGLVKTQSGPMWIGYTVPVEPKDRTMCCFDSVDQLRASGNCCSGCKLESRNGSSFMGNGNNSECENLEPADFAYVMLRAESGQITKARTFSRDCALDAAGLNVYWLNNINPVESIRYLTKLVETDERDESYKKSTGDQAIHAIAIHNNPAADTALESLLAPGKPRRIRQHVAIMLGSERGAKGLAILRRLVKNNGDERFREEALVGFAQSRSDEGLRDLVEIAKTDASSRVRGQSIFWLAQAGGRKEASAITDAIDSDPDTDVKRKAVFALTQMPENEGVPMLIHVVKTNKNPAVRREAIRWLGQSQDPRSLQFLEEILLGSKAN